MHRTPGFAAKGAFRETFRSLLVAGRWLLVAAETAESLLLLSQNRRDLAPEAGAILALLFLYNALTLVFVHRATFVSRKRVLSLLVLDLTFVAAAAWATGGSGSPFLGQCFLIISAAALFYGLQGGVLAGAASALLTGLLVLRNPKGPWEDLRDLGDLAPYFLISGALTGYLVDHLHTWFRRFREGEVETRRRDIAAEAVRREMELAWEMQRAVLPVAPPCVDGLEIAARSEFAREVGGDFHLFLDDGERRGFVVGDVSGKGIPAALAATSIGHLLPWLHPLCDSDQALSDLNQHLCERLPTEAFVTLALVETDLAAGSLRLWSAGHPPPLCWQARTGRVVEACAAPGMALGLFPSWTGEASEIAFDAGDVLLLYSDGLVETRNAQGEQFGAERAGEILAENAVAGPDAVAEALVGRVREWGALDDDLTILVCRRLPEDCP
jgi:hypothetical protein